MLLMVTAREEQMSWHEQVEIGESVKFITEFVVLGKLKMESRESRLRASFGNRSSNIP